MEWVPMILGTMLGCYILWRLWRALLWLIGFVCFLSLSACGSNGEAIIKALATDDASACVSAQTGFAPFYSQVTACHDNSDSGSETTVDKSGVMTFKREAPSTPQAKATTP